MVLKEMQHDDLSPYIALHSRPIVGAGIPIQPVAIVPPEVAIGCKEEVNKSSLLG
jgi:hypothetical protein